MRRLAYSTLTVAIAIALLYGLQVFGAANAAEPKIAPPPLLISITKGTNDLQAVSMALGMAGTALKEGHAVIVFLSVQGPQLADRNLAADVKIADFPPVQKLVRNVIAGGGKVLVCGHCAECCKIEKTSLVDGATPCTREELLKLLQSGMVSLSY